MLPGVEGILRPRVFGSDLHTGGMVFTTTPFYRAETPAILRTSWETQTRISQRNTQGNQNESENLQKSVEESAEDLTDLTPPVTLSGKTLITPRLGASFRISIGKRASLQDYELTTVSANSATWT